MSLSSRSLERVRPLMSRLLGCKPAAGPSRYAVPSRLSTRERSKGPTPPCRRTITPFLLTSFFLPLGRHLICTRLPRLYFARHDDQAHYQRPQGEFLVRFSCRRVRSQPSFRKIVLTLTSPLFPLAAPRPRRPQGTRRSQPWRFARRGIQGCDFQFFLKPSCST